MVRRRRRIMYHTLNICNVYVYNLIHMVQFDQFDSVNFYIKLSSVPLYVYRNGVHFTGENNNTEEMPIKNWQCTCHGWQSFCTNIQFADPNLVVDPLLSTRSSFQRGSASIHFETFKMPTHFELTDTVVNMMPPTCMELLVKNIPFHA